MSCWPSGFLSVLVFKRVDVLDQQRTGFFRSFAGSNYDRIGGFRLRIQRLLIDKRYTALYKYQYCYLFVFSIFTHIESLHPAGVAVVLELKLIFLMNENRQ